MFGYLRRFGKPTACVCVGVKVGVQNVLGALKSARAWLAYMGAVYNAFLGGVFYKTQFLFFLKNVFVVGGNCGLKCSVTVFVVFGVKVGFHKNSPKRLAVIPQKFGLVAFSFMKQKRSLKISWAFRKSSAWSV